MQYGHELRTARLAAEKAAELALGHRASGVTAETKADRSPVTIADRESEKLIASVLLEAFPDDGLLGEEGALQESRSRRRWIIDPIDGTRDYIRGDPFWAVLIGLEDAGRVVLGVANMPDMGAMYFAADGTGAYRNDARIRVSAVTEPGAAVLCINNLNNARTLPFGSRLLDWMSQFWSVRSVGGCLDAMLVASGQADAWIEPSAKPWDLAPLKIITEEAGGRFFGFDGGSTIYGGNCVCCAPGLEGELRNFMAQSRALPSAG